MYVWNLAAFMCCVVSHAFKLFNSNVRYLKKKKKKKKKTSTILPGEYGNLWNWFGYF